MLPPDFWQQFDRYGDVSVCWLWQGRTNDCGHGVYKDDAVHRLTYRELRGEPPAGHDLHHTCEVKVCGNPYHVEPLTKAEHLAAHNSHGAQVLRDKRTCKNGHELSGSNLRKRKDTRRDCRICHNVRQRLWKRKRDAVRRAERSRVRHTGIPR